MFAQSELLSGEKAGEENSNNLEERGMCGTRGRDEEGGGKREKKESDRFGKAG